MATHLGLLLCVSKYSVSVLNFCCCFGDVLLHHWWLLFQGLTGGLGCGLSSGLGDIGSGLPVDALRLYSSMPVLEDGLSSGHASDTDNNNPTVRICSISLALCCL